MLGSVQKIVVRPTPVLDETLRLIIFTCNLALTLFIALLFFSFLSVSFNLHHYFLFFSKWSVMIILRDWLLLLALMKLVPMFLYFGQSGTVTHCFPCCCLPPAMALASMCSCCDRPLAATCWAPECLCATPAWPSGSLLLACKVLLSLLAAGRGQSRARCGADAPAPVAVVPGWSGHRENQPQSLSWPAPIPHLREPFSGEFSSAGDTSSSMQVPPSSFFSLPGSFSIARRTDKKQTFILKVLTSVDTLTFSRDEF